MNCRGLASSKVFSSPLILFTDFSFLMLCTLQIKPSPVLAMDQRYPVCVPFPCDLVDLLPTTSSRDIDLEILCLLNLPEYSFPVEIKGYHRNEEHSDTNASSDDQVRGLDIAVNAAGDGR